MVVEANGFEEGHKSGGAENVSDSANEPDNILAAQIFGRWDKYCHPNVSTAYTILVEVRESEDMPF